MYKILISITFFEKKQRLYNAEQLAIKNKLTAKYGPFLLQMQLMESR